MKKDLEPPAHTEVIKRIKQGVQVYCCRCGYVMTTRDVSSVWCGTCRGYFCEDCVDRTSQCSAGDEPIDVSEFS